MKPDRTLAPDTRTLQKVEAMIPALVRLDNGVPVYLTDGGTQELSRIEIVYRAGSRYQAQALVARFTNLMMAEGTRQRDSFSIASQFEYYGAYYSAYTQKDLAGFSLSFLNHRMENVIPLLAEILHEPSFPEKEFKNLVLREKKNYLDDLQKVSTVAALEFNTRLFGASHPYGKKAKPEDFDLLETSHLRSFYKKYYQQRPEFIQAAGRLPKGLITILNQWFGKAGSCRTFPAQPALKNPHPAQGKIFVEKAGSSQNAMRIGKIALNVHHPDYHGFQILNTILGGYFGSRLMANIREDKGYTYGIYSAHVPFIDAGLFYIAAEVGATVWQKATSEVYNEIRSLSEKAVPENELKLVRNYLTGNLQRMLDGPFNTASFFKGIIEHGLDCRTFFNDYLVSIQNIHADELLRLARENLAEESFLELVCGAK